MTTGQKQLLEQAQAVDTAVQQCNGLTSDQVSQWNIFMTDLTNFCNTQFDWFQTTYPDGTTQFTLPGWGDVGDQLNNFQNQLLSRQQDLSQYCNLGVPNVTTNAQETPDQTATTMLGYVAVAASFIAGAYAIGRIAQVVIAYKPERSLPAEPEHHHSTE